MAAMIAAVDAAIRCHRSLPSLTTKKVDAMISRNESWSFRGSIGRRTVF